MPVSLQCEADHPDSASWFPGCVFPAHPETIDPKMFYVLAKTPELKATAAKDALYQSARRGMTFGIRYSSVDHPAVWLSCVGLPASRVGDCDIEHGDAVCSVSQRLLCLSADPKAQPECSTSEVQSRWLAARVAASRPVRGDALGNL